MEIESILKTGSYVIQNQKTFLTSDHDLTKPVSKCILRKVLMKHQWTLDKCFPFLTRRVMALFRISKYIKYHMVSVATKNQILYSNVGPPIYGVLTSHTTTL